MGSVAITFRIMPDDAETDLEEVKSRVRTSLAGSLRDLQEQPVAFGLKAILAIAVVSDSGGTGVGGGEYRAPVLLILLRNVRWTIAGNLLAGVIVSVAVVVLRGALFQGSDALLLAATMIVTSVPGAYAGALLARRTPAKWLKVFLAGILAATALRLLLFESTSSGPFSFGAEQAALALP